MILIKTRISGKEDIRFLIYKATIVILFTFLAKTNLTILIIILISIFGIVNFF